MSDNITAPSLCCLNVAMLSQEPISRGFADMRASPGFLVWSPAFLFFFVFFSKRSGREGGREHSLSPFRHPLSPFPLAPHHLFRSTNFHLKHVELILPLHRFLFSPLFQEPPMLNSNVIEKHNNKKKTLDLSPELQPLIPLCHRLCVSQCFPFLSLYYPAL